MKVNRTEHRVEKPFAATTSLLATLCALPGVRGTGAPSYPRAWLARLTLAGLIAALALALLAPATSFAAFTRPFLRQLTGTTSGPFERPSSVAVDAENNLWVVGPAGMKAGPFGERLPPFPLDQFNSAELGNSFLKTLEIESSAPTYTPPESLAINRSTGSFYVTGQNHVNPVTHESVGGGFVEVFDNTGAYVSRFGPITGGGVFPHVAVDNSTEPTAGTVYVAHEQPNQFGDGQPPGVEKFDSSGKPVNFTASAPYISANTITGTPDESSYFPARFVAVDSHGNIYAIRKSDGVEPRVDRVDEYKASGEFVRAFTGEETPGLGEHNKQYGGFGGVLTSVAVDPVSGHLLVGVNADAVTIAAIDEFDIASGKFIDQITQTTAGHHLLGVFALAADSKGDIYALENNQFRQGSESAVDAWAPGHFLPSVKLAEAAQRKPESAVVSGEVNPVGQVLSECAFQYVSEAAFQKTGFSDLTSGGKAPCVPASIPVDSTFHPVEAKVAGLTSGATYRYRLVATSSGALGGEGQSAAFAFTAPHAPAVDFTTASNLSTTFADLNAQIRPLGADTTYRFQYVEAAHYEAGAEDPYAAGSSVPVTPADIGSGGFTGGAGAAVLQHLGGLNPGTLYHFRVVASNEVGVTAGPDATFTTLLLLSPGLPDGRAYELVTPPNKGSAEDMFGSRETEFQEFENRDPGYASETGQAFLLETHAAFGAFPASANNDYVFSRTLSGWTYTALASPSLGVQSVNVGVFNPFDLSRVGFDDRSGATASTAGSRIIALAGPPAGPYATLHTDAPFHTGESEQASEQTQVVAASHDLSHLVLQSRSHTLASGAAGQDEGSYALYGSSGGECTPETSACTLLNVDSEGKLLSPCGAVLGLGADIVGASGSPGHTHDAVSADGSRVVITAPDPFAVNKGPGCWNGAASNPPQLYMRSGSTTVEVSKPEAGVSDPSGRHPALYVGASEDGSRVFFVTETELTKDAEGIHDPELYEWRTEGTGGCAQATGCLTRLSAGESGHAAAGVTTVPAVSPDGSAVYFLATGRLTADAPATSGEEVNLYRYNIETGATTYIATVDRDRDYSGANANSWWDTANIHAIALQAEANWYTTPDGRYLLFATTRELTGYHTLAPTFADCPAIPSSLPRNGHCRELYRYDSVSRGLACVSCNPSGAPPTSNAFFVNGSLGAFLKSPAVGPVRAMSNDGSYVFFDSADPLVPQDANATNDVYEWHEGRISLISSGQDSLPSYFLGASPDGANVFFGTHARLVPQDTDTAGDVYDARICTASNPCVKPPAAETAQCEGDACQNPPFVPLALTPASLTFLGAGNLLGEAPTQVKPTNAQKLVNALKVCKKKPKKKRAVCERQARKKYAPAKKKGKR